jgi:hypothetical protein
MSFRQQISITRQVTIFLHEDPRLSPVFLTSSFFFPFPNHFLLQPHNLLVVISSSPGAPRELRSPEYWPSGPLLRHEEAAAPRKEAGSTRGGGRGDRRTAPWPLRKEEEGSPARARRQHRRPARSGPPMGWSSGKELVPPSPACSGSVDGCCGEVPCVARERRLVNGTNKSGFPFLLRGCGRSYQRAHVRPLDQPYI